MVEISSPSSSFNTLNIPRSRSETSSSSSTNKKPAWLIAIYVLFVLVCLNAARTYQSQKQLVRLQIEEREHNDSLEIHDSNHGGGEQHVVNSNYGSSMYGGAISAAGSSTKKKKKPARSRVTAFESIRPKPSDGSQDYNNYIIKNKAGNHSDSISSNFNGFSFYVMTDTPVRRKKLKHASKQTNNTTKE